LLQRIIKGNTDNIKIISKLLTIVFICIITVSVLLCISAFAVSKIDFSYETLPAVIAAILAVSSAFDGFLISKLLKENGLFWGVFVGLIIFAVLIIISLYYSQESLMSENRNIVIILLFMMPLKREILLWIT